MFLCILLNTLFNTLFKVLNILKFEYKQSLCHHDLSGLEENLQKAALFRLDILPNAELHQEQII